MVRAKQKSGIACVDLFAGAGGLGLGVARAGGDLRASIEFDPICCATLLRNKAQGVLLADVAEMSGGEVRQAAKVRSSTPLVIVGGPPCQPFSKAAYWTEEGNDARYRRERARGKAVDRPPPPTAPRPDERRSLVDEFLRLVLEADAAGFLFENVRSILHPRNRPALNSLVAAAEDAGYTVEVASVDASEFGVPQRRQRVFVMGVRGASIKAPTPTHSSDPDTGLLPSRTVGSALGRLRVEPDAEPEVRVKGRWADHLREIPPGWNYKWHTAWANHPSPTFEAETRFWNFLLKLDPGRPSWTIPANPGPWVGPFHWDSRRLTTKELAVLQSFPASYRFEGTRRERVRQIGNAVPPLLAEKMVSAVLDAVSRAPRRRRVVRRG